MTFHRPRRTSASLHSVNFVQLYNTNDVEKEFFVVQVTSPNSVRVRKIKKKNQCDLDRPEIEPAIALLVLGVGYRGR